MAFPSPGADWPTIDAYLKSLGIRINTPTLGETEGGGHVAASEHFQHRARDYPTSNCDAPAIAKALEPFAHGPNYVIDELFYSGTRTWYDSGTYYVPRTSDIEYKNHFSHVHVGIKRGGVLPTKPGSAPQPAPQPAPPAPLRKDDPMYLIQGDKDPTVFATNFVTKQWVGAGEIATFRDNFTEDQQINKLKQSEVDGIPLVGAAPNGYAGERA